MYFFYFSIESSVFVNNTLYNIDLYLIILSILYTINYYCLEIENLFNNLKIGLLL